MDNYELGMKALEYAEQKDISMALQLLNSVQNEPTYGKSHNRYLNKNSKMHVYEANQHRNCSIGLYIARRIKDVLMNMCTIRINNAIDEHNDVDTAIKWCIEYQKLYCRLSSNPHNDYGHLASSIHIVLKRKFPNITPPPHWDCEKWVRDSVTTLEHVETLMCHRTECCYVPQLPWEPHHESSDYSDYSDSDDD